MAITLRQIRLNDNPDSQQTFGAIDNPIDCLIQSTEVSQPDFKLRTRVLVDGAVKADLRIPALGSQYFRFDIAPIVRDYAKYDLLDALNQKQFPLGRIICSELFTSGGVTVEQGAVSSEVIILANTGQNWDDYINSAINLTNAIFAHEAPLIFYKNFALNIVSIIGGTVSGDHYLAYTSDGATIAEASLTGNYLINTLIIQSPSLLHSGNLKIFNEDAEEVAGIEVVAKSPCTRFGRYGLTWLNPLGGYEPLMLCRFAETITDTSERSYYTTQKGKRQGNSIVFDMYNKGRANAARVTTDRNMKLTTDFLTTEEMDNFITIMQSPDVYLYDDELARNGSSFEQSIMPVRIQQGSMEKKYSEKDGLFFAELEIQLDDRIVRHGS